VKLVWHIARKDLRRFALPAAVWAVLIVAPTIALMVIEPGIGPHPPSSLDGWGRVMGIWLQILQGIQAVIALALAAALVLEDSVVETTAFWPTRPISGARLLGGKLLAAALLFCAAPVLALLPVWLAIGFDAIAVTAAASEFVSRFGTLVLFAITVAALVRNLATFLLCAFGLLAVYVASGLAPRPLWQDASMAVRQSREFLATIAIVPALLLAATHQFATRRSVRTWGMIAVVIAFLATVRSVWPWTVEMARTDSAAQTPRAGDHPGDVVAAPAFTQHQANSIPSLYGKTVWHADGFCVPLFARNPAGEVVMRSWDQIWQRTAGLRILGLEAAEQPLWWQLEAPFYFRRVRSSPVEFTGTLEVWSIRARILGETPVRVGAKLQHDATRVRILALLSHESRLDNIYLEERDSSRNTLDRLTVDGLRRDSGHERYIDAYFVVNRATQHAVEAWSHDIGATEINSVVRRFCELGFSWPESYGEPTLVKIRFERDHAFELPLEVRGISTRGLEQFR